MKFGPMRLFEITPLIMTLEFLALSTIIIICFYIYFKTKEIYDLTEHQGVKFFKNGFLFLAIGNLVSLLFNVIMIFKIHKMLEFKMGLFFFLSSFFSLIGLLYLLFSLFYHNKTNKKINKYLIFSIYLLLILTIIVNKHYLLFIHFILLIIFIIVLYLNYIKKKSKKFFSKIFIIYSLLLLFWFINSMRFWIYSNIEYSREFIALFNCVIFVYILLLFRNKFLK